MTAFGKILVFMNLVFSVVTGFLIIMVFDKRTDWKNKYDKMEKRAEAAELLYKSEKLSHENDIKQAESASVELVARARSLQTRLDDAIKAAEDNLKKAQTQETLNSTANTDSQKIQSELAQIRQERQTLIDEKQKLQEKIVQAQKDVDAQKVAAVNADLQAKALFSRNQNLLRQLEELTVKLRDAEQNTTLASGSTTSNRSILLPIPKVAPPGVRGKITAVGKEGTFLAQINVGSDSGLTAGNVLTVFRDDVYVGDLTISGTEPKLAVGKFTPAKRSLAIQVGDSVITSFSSVSQ